MSSLLSHYVGMIPRTLFSLVVVSSMLACGDFDDQIDVVDGDQVTTSHISQSLQTMWGQTSNEVKRQRKWQGSTTTDNRISRAFRERSADAEDIEFVRETGFRPYLEDEDDRELVRETGFMPTPRLTLVDVEDGTALLSWTRCPNVAYYVLTGRIIQEGLREQHGTSFILRTTDASIDLDGDVWEFSVVAVSNDKARRSKASNRVQAVPDAD
ncbi:MAG: hypothetical protein ACPGQS_09650 [Bradymonadia bacterium]